MGDGTADQTGRLPLPESLVVPARLSTIRRYILQRCATIDDPTPPPDLYLSARADPFSPSSNGFPNGTSPALQQNIPSLTQEEGFQFTTIVVGPSLSFTLTSCLPPPGESGLGKSTLINTLLNTPLYPKQPLPPSTERPKTVAIESIGADIENAVRLQLIVVDTPRFGDFVNNDDKCEVSRSACALNTSFQLEAHPG
ncbi:hypothetical protein JVT61DRAFT_15533 [Boletus reticuloceps]|uniref:Septin-type G domain-containing protein n=1 Tax=Boletus reticuloceps TaxID=495285 RepID=A0A8I3A2G5_9AGAM|nr:hypothetical protein JVT61DRAFT_15533 [Boletus reticuloceps]